MTMSEKQGTREGECDTSVKRFNNYWENGHKKNSVWHRFPPVPNTVLKEV